MQKYNTISARYKKHFCHFDWGIMPQSHGAFSGKRVIRSALTVRPPMNRIEPIGPRAPPADRPSTASVFLIFEHVLKTVLKY